jgi:hypothetical protein
MRKKSTEHSIVGNNFDLKTLYRCTQVGKLCDPEQWERRTAEQHNQSKDDSHGKQKRFWLFFAWDQKKSRIID